jgi:signal transduction histidine kinase
MDTTVVRQHPVPGRRHDRLPWSPRAWDQALYLAGAIPVQVFGGLVVFALLLWSHSLSVHANGAALRVTVLWLAGTAVLLALSPVLTRVHRYRLRVTAGIGISPQPKRPGPLTERGVAALRSPATWRQLGYHVLAGPALALAAAAAVLLWPASVALTVAFAGLTLRHGHTVGTQLLDAFVTLIGIAALFFAPVLTSAVRALDILAVRMLLGPSRADELEHRVEQLTETRAGVVDAADAERRRLERDLHDGTQQRLVSLAINLGMARNQVSTADEAKQAIAVAHEEAKAALAELRDLIRGLHPAVLEDRGLDAALSGVAARMPIPVRLTVDLPRRPAPVIEAVAYFVVSEGLANIAKHAEASEAAVHVERAGSRLHVIVTDDGVGGADPARGTGLAGLARRAASVDGTFEIDSPPGGPTLLTVDLPCNR